ncbi:hypothetical protein MT418_000614 [Batrachochytrium dendrobatidis]
MRNTSNFIDDNSLSNEFTKIITQLLTEGELELDSAKLKLIKSSCKASNANVEIVFKTIGRIMNRKHSQIRYACVQLTDVLFMRSSLFRSLHMSQIQSYLSLCFGGNKGVLPPPVEWALKLKHLAASSIFKWHSRFGSLFGELVVAMQVAEPFLPDNTNRNTLVEVPESLSDSQHARTKQIRLEKYLRMRDDFRNVSFGVLENLENLKHCLEIIVPSVEDIFSGGNGTCNVSTTIKSTATSKEFIQAYGLGNNTYSLDITIPGTEFPVETAENQVLFDTLRECTALINNKHLSLISTWIDTITKAEDPDKKSHELFLKKVIDLKFSVLNALEKAKDLLKYSKSQVDNDHVEESRQENSDDEEMFEEVPDPELSEEFNREESIKPSNSPIPTIDTQMLEQPIQPVASGSETNQPQNCYQDNSEFQKLLALAPEVPYDNDLYYWDKQDVSFSSISSNAGLDFHHRFLGDGPTDRVLSKDALSSLRKRQMYLIAEAPKNIPACRAPLRTGALCPRRDLVRCPVHGKIIPRDDTGTPLDPTAEPDQDLALSTTHSSTGRRSKRDTRHSEQPFNRRAPAWKIIEQDVSGALRLSSRQAKLRESKLVDLTKKTNPIQKRILKKINKLDKNSSDSHPEDAELLFKIQDRNLNRW